MNASWFHLMADTLTRTYFESARWHALDQWWHWAALLVAITVILGYIIGMYRRDAQELSTGRRWLLLLLRITAWIGLLIFFLDIEKRTERRFVKPSRVALLIDTSQSMGLIDAPPASPPATEGVTTPPASRLAAITDTLTNSPLLNRLRAQHEVDVYRFDQAVKPSLIMSLPRQGADNAPAAPPNTTSPLSTNTSQNTSTSPASDSPNWQSLLEPRGIETRLGDALRHVIDRERGGPIAGICIMSDGQSNAGIDASEVGAMAERAAISLYPIGIGSEKQAANVRIVDIESPSRVYPGDRFTIRAYLQSTGWEGAEVNVQLLADKDQEPKNIERATVLDERRITCGADGDVTSLQFEHAPQEQGRQIFYVRVMANPRDHDPADNQKFAQVEVVDRKNQVLLFAGGPAREYQFLRNLLFRDRDVVVDVLLQSSQPGASQEAHRLLTEFPATAQELFAYDCIVAIDPDWERITDEQIEWLDRWVAEQAGGLIVVPGPVNTPQWTARPNTDEGMRTLKDLYPVVFHSRSAQLLSASNLGTEVYWPLQLTDEGRQAEFLGLVDTEPTNREFWQGFSGVSAYYPVRGPKPGAKVYSRYSDPQTAVDSELPVYLAGHYYGAGQVVYQGSSEMWRLRGLNEAYFDRYYTKLIRHVSQGRLLRDSTRGVLLVDKQRCALGETVLVRAALTDPQYQPLRDPRVAAVLRPPNGQPQPLVLDAVPDSSRGGMYSGQFVAAQEGDYRVELELADAASPQLLRRDVRVRIPDREIERATRNDALFVDLAKRSGGEYFIGLEGAIGTADAPGLDQALVPQDQVTFLPETPDRDFDQRLKGWLLAPICGALCLEWLIRRLSKLA